MAKSPTGQGNQQLDSVPATGDVLDTLIRQGRPSEFTEAIGNKICDLITEGESIRAICRRPDMPAASTVFKWLVDHPNFSEQYAHAKKESAETYADTINDIADRTLKGEYDPQAARVAIDAYKWTASKLKPKKYGDKLDLSSDGKALPQPILNVFANIGEPKTEDPNRPVIEAENDKEPPKKNILEAIND